MGRYKIVHSANVPNSGKPIWIGYPIEPHMINDICLCCIGKSDFIPLNACILREALLSDPEGMASLLGVKVIDVLGQPEPERPKAEKPKPKKEKRQPIVEDLGAMTEEDK